MTTQQEAEQTWRTYTVSWSVTDAGERNHMLSLVVSPDVEYTDPNIRTTTVEALSGYMAGFQQQMPGGIFRLDSFKFRQNESLAHWTMLTKDGATSATGVSFGKYDEKARLLKMAGFFPMS